MRSRLMLQAAGVALALLTPVLILRPFEAAQAAGDSPSAIFAQGALRLSIPYHAPHAGAGVLTLELLNPEDQVLGRAEQHIDAAEGKGSWQEEIRLAKNLSAEDLIWHRVRYRFLYDGARNPAVEGTESVSQILLRPVLRIIGQQSYLSGGPAAVRVVVTDSKNEPVPGISSIRIDLAGPKPQYLFTGRLNPRGTTEAQFRIPAGITGDYQLRYVAETPLGTTEFVQPVKVEKRASILLTTEKPIYQPGQTIHVRALALDRLNHDAVANRKLTFEVEDSRGNKVFKKATQTDAFGVASAEFALADEVNLGTYHLRALMEGNTAESALNVERYVLPKFKVAVEFGGDKARHGYRPGDHVTGTVRANYFFGKPVDGGEVTVKASAIDVAVFDAASAHGKTGADGAWRFDLRLPNYFAGKALDHGAARVLVEATVKDSANHTETRGEPITVSESPLIITAVPEGGALAPNMENEVFVLTSYADGKPAKTEIRVQGAGNAATDESGVAVVRVVAGAGAETLRIDANDKDGNRASASVKLESRAGEDQVLLRAERAVYRAGDRIRLKVFSTRKQGTAYIDIVREGQTVLTRDLDIVNGQAELSLTATPDLAGTVDFSAYLFGRDARPVGDHRLIFVQPADELKIEASTGAAVYKPGDDARIRFRVTNSKGEGVHAVLGLQVVDEAVFALAEKQPGFAKVFFYLEQEVMKPRYEIHSVGMPEVIDAVANEDRAARALFAATELVRPNRFETEVGRLVPAAKQWDYARRYQERVFAVVQKAKWTAGVPSGLRDPWDTTLRITPAPWGPRNQYYEVRSAGPDKRFDTPDDLANYISLQTKRAVGPPTSGTIQVNIEHERGPMNALAEMTGTVTDTTGALVAGATVSARERTTRKTRTASANAAGQFTLAGLTPGSYDVQVSSPGFQMPAREIALRARDRAVLAVMLQVGAVTEMVTVEAMPVRMEAAMAVGGELRLMAKAGQQGATMGAMAAPAAQMFDMVAMKERDANMAVVVKDKRDLPGSPAPRVRSYFPEALYINPEIITDRDGRASVSIPIADSITTWRMAMMASTARGALGSGTSSIKVFQDFFTDLDLPVTLTQGDRVSIPVAVYNYSGAQGDVSLQLQQEDWFSLVQDEPQKNLAVEAGRVRGSQFTIEAKRIGRFKLTLNASMKGGARRADIVVREIEVVPNGREQTQVFNGRLETTVQHAVNFPAAAIPDAGKIFVRLYPGPLSQVIEGMDAILRMPGGCFEQTSSSTYPNVLALDYMKRTKKLTPEVHAKAEGYIANGYQRLLTFEVPGGGFSWFGNPPANKILTGYGLMEFSDMAKVHDVDARLIERTQQWIASQQQPDGSWKPDTNFINEGATNRYNTDVLRITAYLAWSLGNTGYKGPAIENAKQYIDQHMNAKADSYTLAVLANFAVDYGKDREFLRRAMQQLLDARTEKGEEISWTADETGVYGTGASASIETTGLAVQALLKWPEGSGSAAKALKYIASKKDASGTWGTTQATIMALRALLLSTEKGTADVRGTVEVTLNGKTVETLALTPENNDLLHQFLLKNVDAKGPNTVALRFAGKGSLAYQVTGSWFLPWNEKPANEPLSIAVAYDRANLAQDDIATATATVRNNLNKVANMVMIDLGIPPGFDLLSEDLQDMQEKTATHKGGRLEKFSMTATQAILYFDSVPAGSTVTVKYRLRAKYPIRAKTFASRVYEYYAPEVSATAKPIQLEVKAK